MKLSIVITAYNVAPYIEECVNSVLKQKLGVHSMEVIVVEDKSTDSTLEILESIDNITIYKNEINVGAGLSRRFGIKQATGDYVMLIDGDDYLENETHLIELINRALETNADVVGGGIKVLREDGSYDITSYGNYTCRGYENITKFWGERIVFMNNKIIRRSMYDEFPYCHRRYIEDTPVIIPILWKANRVEYVDSVGYVYRMRSTSLTHQANDIKNIIFKGLCWCDLYEFFEKNDSEVFNHISIKQYIGNLLNHINNRKIDIEDIQPWGNEFSELMFRLLNIIKITAIDFK